MQDEMDILREVGSISAGQGSIALSEILGKKIGLKMPSLDLIPSTEIFSRISSGQPVISVSCNILSGLKGTVLFLLEEKSAFGLVDACYKINPDDKKSGTLTEMGLSLIKEVGNVVISSYLGALSIMLKKLVIPSIPTLVSGPVQQILGMVINPKVEEYVMLIEAVFEEPDAKIVGSFYLALNPESVKYIQEACKKLLEALK